MRHLYYHKTREPLSNHALKEALGTLEARALYEGPEHQVELRVAEYENKLYLDLANDKWEAVEISARGWRLLKRPPIRFRRTPAMEALPVPVAGGSIDALREFFSLASYEDFPLAVAWLLACFRPRGPYPVLVLTGEQDSAKSTCARVLRSLTDPNSAPLRSLPSEAHDLFIMATRSRMLVIDNVSSLPRWLSDDLCRLASGGGISFRKLYSDDEEVIFQGQRPIILTGIGDIAPRADLANRALFLHLEPIADECRKTEKELDKRLRRARPKILGALLDAVAVGIRELPGVKLRSLPRMADFATWGTACESALWEPGRFMEVYAANRNRSDCLVIESNPVTAALCQFENGGAKLDHRAAIRSRFWAE